MYLIHFLTIGLTVLALFSLGCATPPKAPRMGPDDYPNATVPLSQQNAPDVGSERPANPALEYLDIDHPDLQEPMRQFRETGRPPVIRHKDRRYVRYPFGHSKIFSKARMAVGVGRKADEVYITRKKPSELAEEQTALDSSALPHSR